MRRSLEDAKRTLLERRVTLVVRTLEQGPSPTTEVEGRELLEIDAALERVDADRYGQCELCGSAVGPGRLRAIPEARLCIDCSTTGLQSPRR